MLIPQIVKYTEELELALDDGDLESIRVISQDCDRLLRKSLPLPDRHGEDLAQLADDMDLLLVSYRRAIELVEKAKVEAGSQLQTLGRNSVSTHKYLDIARNMGA